VTTNRACGGSHGWTNVHSGARDGFASAALQDEHKKVFVTDRIDNPMISVSNAIELFPAVERLHSMWTRSSPKGMKPFDDEFLKRFGEGFELSFSRRREKEREHYRKESELKS
jgi:hypothetical protein